MCDDVHTAPVLLPRVYGGEVSNLTKIRCCPFCGFEGCVVEFNNGDFYIACGQCGAEGPCIHALIWSEDKAEDAILEWNKRVD